MMKEVFFVKAVSSPIYEEVLEKQVGSFKKGMKVAVKLHFGEGKGRFDSEIARRSINVLKRIGCEPFLIDTLVLYPGPRTLKSTHHMLAKSHGFSEKTMGCPIIISDDHVVVKTEHMNVEVSKEIAEADAMLVLTHGTGHACSAFGGSIKNIAMGCVSKRTKKNQHKMGMPTVNDDCTACGMCAKVCPFHAISVGKKANIMSLLCFGCSTCVYNCPVNAIQSNVTFDRLMAESVSAVLSFYKNNNKPVVYVNDLRKITRMCDCVRTPGEPIIEDVGVFISDDACAIDKASIDYINDKAGKNFFKESHNHEPVFQVNECEALGVGESKYKLVRINL